MHIHNDHYGYSLVHGITSELTFRPSAYPYTSFKDDSDGSCILEFNGWTSAITEYLQSTISATPAIYTLSLEL